MIEQHTCAACGKTGPWTRSWSWYGSLLQSEAFPDTPDKVCSRACREKHKPSAACLTGHKRALAEARKVKHPRVYDRPHYR